METTNQKDEANGAASGRLKRLVMWLREWDRKQKAKRLYRQLWKANTILLHERHSSLYSKDNKEFHSELERCSAQLERTINVVKKRFAT